MVVKRLFNLKIQKSTRQHLRNRSTKSEKVLWYHLRESNLGGYKFRRQQGIGHYVVDFYCPVANLAIELDGDSHYPDATTPNPSSVRRGIAARDAARQKFIEARGIRVLRFTDNDIKESLSNVLEIILKELRITPTTPNPSSGRRGDASLTLS